MNSSESIQRLYVYCICMSIRALHQRYTRLLCYTASARVVSQSLENWLECKQNDTGTAVQGVANYPKCPGTECPDWTEGVIKSPLLNGCPDVRLHSLTLCVYMCPSLAVLLSVIHKSGFINNMKAARLCLCTYSTCTRSDATSTLLLHKKIRLSRNTSDAFISNIQYMVFNCVHFVLQNI